MAAVRLAPDALGHEVLSRMQARPTTPTPPGMVRVMSEPTMRHRDSPEESLSKTRRGEFRSGLADLMQLLDAQGEKRRKDHRCAIWAEEAKVAMREAYQRSLDAQRKPDTAAWTYCDYAGYFQKPLLEEGPSLCHVKNDLLQGIYDVKDKEYQPPHAECNVYGGWNPFRTNDRGLELAEFGTKLPHRMGPTEKKFANRLERKLERVRAIEKAEALQNTSGAYKKGLIEKTAHEFSCLKREKPPWVDQAVYTHTYFSEYPPYKPGDHPYETMLDEYIVQSEKAKSYERDVVIGDHERTSFWRPRATAAATGTTRRLNLSQELGCPPGVRKVREAAKLRALSASASSRHIAR